jgi:hypothetical protein
MNGVRALCTPFRNSRFLKDVSMFGMDLELGVLWIPAGLIAIVLTVALLFLTVG